MSSSAKGILVGSISGFPEFLPKDQIAFNRCIDLIRKEFESFGFIPLDTPAVEKASTLLSKGNDNEIYGLCRLTSEGVDKKELGLRFDLTVPLARYVAEHAGQLVFPFKRYHIAPVWRGERAQAGRYRQFIQCDIDVIAEETLDFAYDAELLACAYRIFEKIGLKNYQIKLNNRKVLIGLMESFGVEKEQVDAVLRQIDKKDKIDRTAMITGLQTLGVSQHSIEHICHLLDFDKDLDQTIHFLESFTNNDGLAQGVLELKNLIELARAFQVNMQVIKIDLTLARGLNYYTGTIYEAKWLDCPEIGSILGGGRYQNLAATFTKRILPGVGISIGVSRLIPKMMEKGLIANETQTLAKALIAVQDRDYLDFYISLAEKLRATGVGAEVFLQNKPLSNQIKYADRKGFDLVVIANGEEIQKNVLNVKFLKTNLQSVYNVEEFIESAHQL
jgi:histidyl-tRNA synthetase